MVLGSRGNEPVSTRLFALSGALAIGLVSLQVVGKVNSSTSIK